MGRHRRRRDFFSSGHTRSTDSGGPLGGLAVIIIIIVVICAAFGHHDKAANSAINAAPAFNAPSPPAPTFNALSPNFSAHVLHRPEPTIALPYNRYKHTPSITKDGIVITNIERDKFGNLIRAWQ